MGQGLYDMLGWGVLTPPILTMTDADGAVRIDDALLVAVEHLGLRGAHEVETGYLIIPLAVSDPVLQKWWKLLALPDWCPRVGARRARVIEGAQEVGRELGRQRGVDCPAIWQEAQRLYAERGLRLPDATLIIARDYD